MVTGGFANFTLYTNKTLTLLHGENLTSFIGILKMNKIFRSNTMITFGTRTSLLLNWYLL